MGKKKKCPEFENHERWLVAYADMMTLLFALFVVLYAIQNQDMEKLKAAAKSIQKAFGMGTEEIPDATGYAAGNAQREDAIFTKVKGNTSRESLATRNRRERAAIIAADTVTLERVLKDEFKGTKDFPSLSGESSERIVYFNKDPDGIRISLLARGFFEAGRVELDKSSFRILDGVATAVKAVGRIVRVEGHTDATTANISIGLMKEPVSNWELSVLRASTVLRYFTEKHKFPENQIYAAGFGSTRPVAPNDTMQHRSLNRRIDIKVLYETPTDYMAPDKIPETEEAPAGEEKPATPEENAKPAH